jgi:osmotically-inducible protein OsmY
MKVLLSLTLGIAIGAAVVWYYQTQPHTATPGGTNDTLQAATDAVQEKLRSLHLSGDDIKQELDRTGRVIRQKAQQAGQALSDATADARITAAIKAKLLRDPDLSAWNISVSTTDGVVTLAGAVSSPEAVGKAMLLAMETDGVREAISTLQVKRAV